MSKNLIRNDGPVIGAMAFAVSTDVPAAREQPTQPQVESKRLVWTGRYAPDWEILVYEKSDGWEACFFKWDIYHEHVTGLSLDDARRKAEAMIDTLQS